MAVGAVFVRIARNGLLRISGLALAAVLHDACRLVRVGRFEVEDANKARRRKSDGGGQQRRDKQQLSAHVGAIFCRAEHPVKRKEAGIARGPRLSPAANYGLE